MTSYCPRCGEAGRDEAVVVPLVAVWSSCKGCQFVWRSSLLDAVTTFAMRRVGLARYEKVEDRRSASALLDTSALRSPVPLAGADSDRVAQWFASQEKATPTATLAPVKVAREYREPVAVEEFFDQLAPKEDFSSFFSDNGVTEEALIEERLAEELPAEASFADETPRSADTPLEASLDRALTNVDHLYDAYKRLEQQLGGMEELCGQLAPAPSPIVHRRRRRSTISVSPRTYSQPRAR